MGSAGGGRPPRSVARHAPAADAATCSRNEQPAASAAERVAAFCDARRDQLDVVPGLSHDLKAVARPPLPALLVLMRELGRLVESEGEQRKAVVIATKRRHNAAGAA